MQQRLLSKPTLCPRCQRAVLCPCPCPSFAASQLSRLVRLQGLGDAQALVPWADFANHSPAASAFLDWDPRAGPEGAGAVVLLTERAYEQGEQVCE